MTDNNNIEKLFKDTFDNFEPNVDASVWNGVEQGIKNVPATPASAVVKSFSALKSVIAIVSVATIAVVTYTILKTKSPEAIVSSVKSIQTAEQYKFNSDAKINSESESNSSSSQLLSAPKPTQTLKVQEQTLQTGDVENIPVQNEQPAVVEHSNLAASTVNTSQPGTSQPSAVLQKQMQTEQTPEQTSAEADDSKESAPASSQTCELNLSNTFTPIGDGINDSYFIEDNNLSELHVKILDLRGNLIKQWNSTEGSWDGKLSNNADAPNGTYLLIVNAICKNGEAFNKKNQIRLIRQ